MSIQNYIPPAVSSVEDRVGKTGQISPNFSFKLAPILTTLIAFTFFFDVGHDVHWPPWAYLTLVIVLTLSWQLIAQKRHSLIGLVLMAYITVNGLIMMSWRPLTAAMPFAEKVAIRSTAAHATVEFLLLSILFITQWPKIRKPIGWGLFIGGAFHAFFLILDQIAPLLIDIPSHLAPAFMTQGLLGNRSIGASFAAVWLFFGLHILNAWLPCGIRRAWLITMTVALGLGSVLISVSSISYGALIAACASLALAVASRLRMITPLMIGIIILVTVTMALAGSFIDPDWYQHISRYDAWPMFYKYFGSHDMLIFGGGAGSFKYYGPLIQEMNQYMVGRYWLWAHSDWLQIVLEFGYIGLALSVAFYMSLLHKAWERPLLLSAIIAYGVVMAGNYPLHIAMTGLIGWWLAFESTGPYR